MGDITGFVKVKRKDLPHRPVEERKKDFREVTVAAAPDHAREQASRCMNCGTPFCHWGCPAGNYIPEWNDFVFQGRWKEALELLLTQNNFPEITGRVCPAFCEYACVLGINDEAVTVRENELAIVEYGFKHALIRPRPPERRTGKQVAVVGSGPAGLACADQLNRAGHTVTVFERADKPGGLLRYGIPEFKLEKRILDRRLKLLAEEGITFTCGVNVDGKMMRDLRGRFEAVCLAIGSRVPRDMKVEGRDLAGIHFALDYLTDLNRLADAGGKNVVVIGGGDTGSDCVGVAHRQGAKSIVQLELLPQPSETRTAAFPWPKYPLLLKTTSSHEEGGERLWGVLTKRFAGTEGRVRKLECVRVEWENGVMKEIPGSGFELEADIVILAMGFLHPEHEGLVADLGLATDQRGNVLTDDCYSTSEKGVFAAGDMHRGQSLVVWAMCEGRSAARCIDDFLVCHSRGCQ